MGSTGGGSFSDYSQRPSNNASGSNGGASGKDKCGEAFTSTLEEVSRCFYFMNAGTVPPVGTDVTITFNGSRLVAETDLGEEIGYLPTMRNYLKVCIDNGFRYGGAVTFSIKSPIPGVTIDVVPQ